MSLEFDENDVVSTDILIESQNNFISQITKCKTFHK